MFWSSFGGCWHLWDVPRRRGCPCLCPKETGSNTTNTLDEESGNGNEYGSTNTVSRDKTGSSSPLLRNHTDLPRTMNQNEHLDYGAASIVEGKLNGASVVEGESNRPKDGPKDDGPSTPSSGCWSC